MKEGLKVKTVRSVAHYAGDFETVFEPIEDSISLKKTKTGYEMRYLVQDTDIPSPEEWDNESAFLVGYHTDFWVDRKKTISKDLAVAIYNGGKDEYGEINEEAQEYLKKYHTFLLEAYIHSGVRLALSYEGNFPDRRWDVSQVGLVFVSKKEFKKRDKARKAARDLIKTWNSWLSGDVYMIVKETYNKEKEQLDYDCIGGYYGQEYALEALKTEI